MSAISLGNTFDKESLKIGHSRIVWREVSNQYQAGGTIANIADWVSKGKVPAGTPCKYDLSAKTITAYTDTQITGASDITTLGINGYLLKDTLVKDANTVGSNTVIYHGELYSYMIASAVLAKVKGLATTPMIVFV